MKIEKINKKCREITEINAVGETCIFQGYPVEELCNNLKSAEQVEFISKDGEVVALSGEEILEGRVYLAEEEGTFRLMLLKDTHKRRWCKNIQEMIQREAENT